MWRIFLAFILLPLCSFSQNDSGQYIDYGLLRMQGNIAMGTMLAQSTANYYIAGELEYYTSSSISIRGSSSFLLGSTNTLTGFRANHSILLGALYHLKTKNNFDPFLGIEPGFAISKLCGCIYSDSEEPLLERKGSKRPTTANPIFTTALGFNYFANKYFNLFANVRLILGKHYSDIGAVSLNELKFSFGLGFHLWTKKGYCKFNKPL